MHKNHYRGLLIMAVLAFISMYVLMYAMVNRLEHVHSNINQFWMAGPMTTSMLGIEVFLMKSMNPDKRMNLIVIAVSVVAGILSFLLIRQQIAITDQQSPLEDAEIKEL